MTGFIYFARVRDAGLIKIGFSRRNPIHRLKTISSEIRKKVDLLFYIRGDMKDESNLHKHFKGHNYFGEYFHESGSLHDFLKSRNVAGIISKKWSRRKMETRAKLKCHECRKVFTPNRTDQVFHNTKCRMAWFGRKAKIAKDVFDYLISGEHKSAMNLVHQWKLDMDRRAAQ